MPYTPQQAPAALDTDGLRKFSEEQLREIARAWTELEKNITALQAAISGLPASYVTSIATLSGAFTLNGTSGITNLVNDIRLSPASASQFGAVKVDGTTITSAGGVISTVAPAASSPWVLLNTLTASNSATLSDTTSFTSAYKDYEIVITEMVPATNNMSLQLQVQSGGTFKTTGYLTSAFTSTSASGTASAGPTTGIPLSYPTVVANASPGVSSSIRCYNPSANQITHWTGSHSSIRTGGTISDGGFMGGFWNTAGVITGFQVLFTSGNITSGTVRIYGRA